MTNLKTKSFAITTAPVAFTGWLNGAESKPIAPKPPLGWNSFDSYGVYLHEKAAMENVEAMAEHLKPYGCE
jgi:hypothetical protein